ncbi:hypothetical protein B484DRAFT_43395 [Ochromonadaceae sp. CCMP2298]|nr:hypothetical protein B484DRAFT_43395 [Ochromonadaceae sp. CCMP2298]
MLLMFLSIYTLKPSTGINTCTRCVCVLLPVYTYSSYIYPKTPITPPPSPMLSHNTPYPLTPTPPYPPNTPPHPHSIP